MSRGRRSFDLPNKVERYLAALSKLCAQDGNRDLQALIVNAQVRIHEEWTYDDWSDGRWGHALFLTVPEPLFLKSAKTMNEVTTEIKEAINRLNNVRDEFIAAVFIEMDVPDGADWRHESGLLLTGQRQVTDEAIARIWGGDGFRIFLSHKTSAKRQTAILKEQLSLFGFSCFVAHEDISPTKAWQDEIENALASMDGFVALMTEDFHDSDWTDQEVGYALARGVPMISVRLGLDPYGFIGKFQAVTSSWKAAPVDIARVLVKNDRGLSAYIAALKKCRSWDDANTLASLLPAIDHLAPSQVDDLVNAYNANGELRGGWGFNGSRPGTYGPGLVHYLNRHDQRPFRLANGLIERTE